MENRTSIVEPAFAIETQGLCQRFEETVALSSVDLRIRKGELFGVIGPDGAGKSTLFQILAGIMPVTGGTASVFAQNPRDARLRTGYMTQHFSLYAELTIDENLRYAGGARNVPEAQFLQRREKHLQQMNLLQFCDRLAGHLSGGMKQKLALCCALIANPDILLLDEPTTGLDPVSRREFWHLLATIAEAGTTTVVATPQFDEAELCTRVALMHSGRVYKTGSPDQLREEVALTRFEVRSEAKTLSAISASLREQQQPSEFAFSDVNIYGDRLDILSADPLLARDQIDLIISKYPTDHNVISVEQPTLENVFITNLRSQGFTEPSAPPFPWTEERRIPSGAEAEAAISANHLGKRFNHFQAVDDVSLTVNYGEIYGLLGANGAGKTTTVQMLTGLIQATTGEVTIAGESKKLRSSNLRRRMGYMSQKFTLYDDLTILENLAFYAAAYKIPPSARKQKIEWVLQMCALEDSQNILVGQLPRGLKQRIAFGAAVMHEPEVLFLDEPTAGIDPLARRQLWKIIREFAQSGTAVLVTTHFLDDAEYCSRLGLMVEGKLVAQGSPSQIKERSGSILQISTEAVHSCFEFLSGRIEASLISVLPGRVRLHGDMQAAFVAKLRDTLAQAQIPVSDIQPIQSSLEDAFVSIVHANRRDKE